MGECLRSMWVVVGAGDGRVAQCLAYTTMPTAHRAKKVIACHEAASIVIPDAGEARGGICFGFGCHIQG